MTIITRDEYDNNDFGRLYDNSWSGAVDTLNDIKNANLEVEFMDYLEELYGAEEVDSTELNDYIWFERDSIYEALGLDENGEVQSDDEEEEE